MKNEANKADIEYHIKHLIQLSVVLNIVITIIIGHIVYVMYYPVEWTWFVAFFSFTIIVCILETLLRRAGRELAETLDVAFRIIKEKA